MRDSEEALVKFLEAFDMKKSLHELTKGEVKEWITKEWNELIEDGTAFKETTTIILDSNHKWMQVNKENKLFVYVELLALNTAAKQLETMKLLKEEINTIKKEEL